MEQLFNIDFKKISSSSEKEALKRKKNFELFLKTGLPNKKDESWKFSDFHLNRLHVEPKLMKQLY